MPSKLVIFKKIFYLSPQDHSNFINCVHFSPNGSHFCSVGSDKKAILFDGKTGERVCYLGDPAKKEAHSGGIYGVSSIYMSDYYMYIEKINVQCSEYIQFIFLSHIRSSYVTQYAYTCMSRVTYMYKHMYTCAYKYTCISCKCTCNCKFCDVLPLCAKVDECIKKNKFKCSTYMHFIFSSHI